MEQDHDLLLITDATASMSNYLQALHQSLPQIISVSALTGCFSNIGLLAYRDYSEDGDELLEWSGWMSPSLDSDVEQPNLTARAESLEAFGGGDYPEATKTALAKAYEVMRPEAKTIILIYTDAPPHAKQGPGGHSNAPREFRTLSQPESYGGVGPRFADWVSACNQLHNGEKKAQVFCVLEDNMQPQCVSFYNYICAITRGACFNLENSKPESISRVTMALLISWMGVEKAESQNGGPVEYPAHMSRYINVRNITKLRDEEDQEAAIFLATPYSHPKKVQKVSDNTTSTRMTSLSLQKHLPKKDVPVTDFAKAWSTDPAYQAMAVKHLRNIINENVLSITLNPVFGALWRAVCNDRKHEARDGLVEAFSTQINNITNDEERARAKIWLEESYDHTGEVLETIESVSEEDRYPCVFLDPTLRFTKADPDTHENDDADINRPITEFTRAELLEIGRTCDPRILRRLGRVLTRLTYVEKSADMPEHIAATSDEDVPKIPMALASKKYDAKFWKILLHTIVPGTLLSTRPAALLAALSLRMGVAPLNQAAERQMISFRNNWNNIEVPENWNVSCLSLLLDADEVYRKRQDSLRLQSGEQDSGMKPSTLLKESDRELFQSLCKFRMLELNLDSTLTARVGWTPEKTLTSIGPLVTCRSCKYPRSVTIMGKNQKCGVCIAPDYKSPKEAERCSRIGVSMEDNESTQATWVECGIRSCRAQYVVYNVDDLNVRPKCHYCRQRESSAPWVECKRCTNRMLWPKAYRPSSFVESEFSCPACSVGRETIVNSEVTAKKISAESSMSWLIRDSVEPDQNPFSNRSLYHTISTIGTDSFLSRFNLFPPIKGSLTLHGKLILNTPELISTLQNLISQRQTERAVCSLCFSTFRKDAVNPACGRRGCFQRICKTCLSGWYGLNQAGRIINVAALSCPFCRRLPTPQTLIKYGMGIHSVRDLSNAVRDQGTWIYAWCRDCHTAKQYVERVCARGMPEEINNWSCDVCRAVREQQRLEREQLAIEQARADAQAAWDIRARERAEAALRTLEQKQEANRLKTIMECPGCGTMTEKISGCGHIECPVRGCGIHYCYFCGEKSWGSEPIYEHMEKEHGGIYGPMEDDVGDDDDEYFEYRCCY
ncbi:hypothetical protein FQN54_005608 [Arachnomyces sp. PD_36]|nr:hypothetical protein FQN54_005608 [Arachnomyces sp. PD_36]